MFRNASANEIVFAGKSKIEADVEAPAGAGNAAANALVKLSTEKYSVNCYSLKCIALI